MEDEGNPNVVHLREGYVPTPMQKMVIPGDVSKGVEPTNMIHAPEIFAPLPTNMIPAPPPPPPDTPTR